MTELIPTKLRWVGQADHSSEWVLKKVKPTIKTIKFFSLSLCELQKKNDCLRYTASSVNNWHSYYTDNSILETPQVV